MSITLDLVKPGDKVEKIELNLSKGDTFKVDLLWECQHDLDAHALLLKDGKLQSADGILSCYNKQNNTQKADKSFSTKDESLTHSGDCLDGQNQDIDESITIDGSKIPQGINEIAIFITIHGDQSKTFEEVKDAKVRVNDPSGNQLEEFVLSDSFKENNAVQMGSLMLENGSWSFVAAGSGFNGDFNFILSNFS